MKKLLLCLFLIMSLNVFSSEKLQALKPDFESFVQVSLKSFEQILKESISPLTFNGNLLVKKNSYTSDKLTTTIGPSKELEKLLKESGEEIPQNELILISLEEVEQNYFVLTISAENEPEYMEGDYEYMKSLIPFLRETAKNIY